MNSDRIRILIRSAILCVMSVILLGVGLKLSDMRQDRLYREQRLGGTGEFMDMNVVIRNGIRYRKTPAVSTFLIAGIDQTEDTAGVSTSSYRDGGQADFILLLAIDHTSRQIRQLLIDRDTMADVMVLSVYGKETGTRKLQICLAHSYGANGQENAKYLIRSVRRLMDDIEIDGYYMVDYRAVPVLNDALGGVTVTIPADMTGVNPSWSEGSVVTLQGGEAEAFVRARKNVGEGTNEERMLRQNVYMQSAVSQLKKTLSEDAEFGEKLLADLKSQAVTNLSEQSLLQELSEAASYEVLPVETLEGEYKIGEGGFMEFHVKEGSPSRWILENLYTRETS